MQSNILSKNNKYIKEENRTIHEEAKGPTYDTVEQVYNRRWNYLSHILRLDVEQAVRRYLLELSPTESIFTPGSLFADTKFRDVETMIQVANDRNLWKKTYENIRNKRDTEKLVE